MTGDGREHAGQAVQWQSRAERYTRAAPFPSRRRSSSNWLGWLAQAGCTASSEAAGTRQQAGQAGRSGERRTSARYRACRSRRQGRHRGVRRRLSTHLPTHNATRRPLSGNQPFRRKLPHGTGFDSPTSLTRGQLDQGRCRCVSSCSDGWLGRAGRGGGRGNTRCLQRFIIFLSMEKMNKVNLLSSQNQYLGSQ